MTKSKIKIFSLCFRASDPIRHIVAMEVLNYNFLTIFAPVKTWIVIEYGYIAFALHWVNFTSVWQRQAS